MFYDQNISIGRCLAPKKQKKNGAITYFPLHVRDARLFLVHKHSPLGISKPERAEIYRAVMVKLITLEDRWPSLGSQLAHDCQT